VTEIQRESDAYLLAHLSHGGALPEDVAGHLLHGAEVTEGVIAREFARISTLCGLDPNGGDTARLAREQQQRQDAEDERARRAREAAAAPEPTLWQRLLGQLGPRADE
jgi:hypothetical protein